MLILNILFPALGYFITLGISMLLIGILQKRDQEPLRARQMAVVVLLPYLFILLLALASWLELIDYSLSPRVMLAYFVIPLLALWLWHKKSLAYSALCGLIVALAALCSSTVLMFVVQAIN